MSLFQVNFHEAFRSLWGSRQRSLLALIGIVIGIGSVIGMVSIGDVVKHRVAEIELESSEIRAYIFTA